jgi:hypothetical protein
MLRSSCCATFAALDSVGMILTAHRVARFTAAALPFALVPVLLTWSIGPMARTGARWFHLAADDLPLAATEPIAPAAPPESDPRGDPAASIGGDQVAQHGVIRQEHVDRHAPRPTYRAAAKGASIASIAGSFGGERRAEAGKRTHVFLGPESIQRAIPAPGRPTSSWTNRTAEHPAGLLIQTPGALTGVIESGDILFEAEGQPIGSFEQLVVTVKQAYERRVKRLSGRIFRKGDLVPVTVEPGW